VNLVLSYIFGKDLSWQANMRWNYGSGFPFTPTQGFYPMTLLNNSGSTIAVTNPSLGVLYAQFDSQRLPDYARMDVSLSKSFQFSQSMALRLNASVINLFDRTNIFYFNRITGQQVNQFPILPTLSVGLDF
jgi:outer membrane receptor protein involved in Fe transport